MKMVKSFKFKTNFRFASFLLKVLAMFIHIARDEWRKYWLPFGNINRELFDQYLLTILCSEDLEMNVRCVIIIGDYLTMTEKFSIINLNEKPHFRVLSYLNQFEDNVIEITIQPEYLEKLYLKMSLQNQLENMKF